MTNQSNDVRYVTNYEAERSRSLIGSPPAQAFIDDGPHSIIKTQTALKSREGDIERHIRWQGKED